MSLESIDGFKKIFPKYFFGLLGGGKATRSFEIYKSAEHKGVYENFVLRKDEHDDFHYVIAAFSTKGTLDPATMEILRSKATEIDLGTIRYESTSYSLLEPWRGEPGSIASEETAITSLAEGLDGVFIYPAVGDAPADLDCPLIVHANKGGQDYIYPVPRTKLA